MVTDPLSKTKFVSRNKENSLRIGKIDIYHSKKKEDPKLEEKQDYNQMMGLLSMMGMGMFQKKTGNVHQPMQTNSQPLQHKTQEKVLQIESQEIKKEKSEETKAFVEENSIKEEKKVVETKRDTAAPQTQLDFNGMFVYMQQFVDYRFKELQKTVETKISSVETKLDRLIETVEKLQTKAENGK